MTPGPMIDWNEDPYKYWAGRNRARADELAEAAAWEDAYWSEQGRADRSKRRKTSWAAAIALGAAFLAYLWWGVTAHASPLAQGDPRLRCMPIDQKASAMARAHELGNVLTFNESDSKKLIDAVNRQKPVTDYEASVVDVVITDDPQIPVHVFFTDDKLFCMAGLLDKKSWEKTIDGVFGPGT